MPWGDTCLPPTGANITLPPSGDRKIPLTIAIPVQSDGVCGSQPVATQESKYQTVATDYSGPCSTITNLGYAGSTPTTYRFPPGPDETLGLEVICKPGSPRPHSCGACVTYTKIVEGLPMPITISIPPTGTQTDGSVIVITPPPVPDADGDGTVTVIQPLPTGTDAITTTLQPGSPGDPTTVIVLEPTDALPGVTTITRPGTSTVPITSTILPAPGSGGTTSVIIVEPTSVPGGTVTVTTIVPGGPGFTTTLTATDPSEPDTVIIGTTAPAATITITSVITDDSPAFTTTIMATDPDDQDTVIIGIPTSDPAPTVTPDTTTFTVPIPAGSSYETTITATDDGPDNVIIGSPAPEEPNTDRGREFPTLPGLPPPDETGITNVPAETPDTTTENTITPIFVFRSDTTTAATEPTDGGETEDGETATPTPTGNPEEGESGEGGEGGEGGATGIDATPGPSETAPLADTFCDNIGFRYAMIPHNYYNSDAPTYSNVDVVGLRESRPVYVGQARKIGFPPYPGAPDFNLEYMAINHEAWINAVIAGEYTFELPFVDDIAFVWVGTDAYSGWTRENADAVLGIFGGSATLSLSRLAFTLLFVFCLSMAKAGTSFGLPFGTRTATLLRMRMASMKHTSSRIRAATLRLTSRPN